MCGRRDPCIPTWRGSDGATGNEGTEESAGGGPHQLGQTVFLHASVWRKLGAPANGLELSCRASRIRFRIDRFCAAGPVSCSELLCVPQSKTRPHRHDLLPSLSPPTHPCREPPSLSGNGPGPWSPTCGPTSPFRLIARGAIAGKTRSNLWTSPDSTPQVATSKIHYSP